MTIKRYTIPMHTDLQNNTFTVVPCPDNDGEWVAWQDVERLPQRIAELETLLVDPFLNTYYTYDTPVCSWCLNHRVEGHTEDCSWREVMGGK